MPAVCDLFLGVLLYKSRLVPRGLSIIGIIGGPVLVGRHPRPIARLGRP